MRTEFIDFPTAWEIQHDVGTQLDHHPRCSSVSGHDSLSGPGLLCDCGAMPREWARRAIALEPERKAEIEQILQRYLPPAERIGGGRT